MQRFVGPLDKLVSGEDPLNALAQTLNAMLLTSLEKSVGTFTKHENCLENSPPIQELAMRLAKSVSFMIAFAVTTVALTSSPAAAADGDLVGRFVGKVLSLESKQQGTNYVGTIERAGAKFPFTATASGNTLTGHFEFQGNKFPFTATLTGAAMELSTGGASYQLAKQVANPLIPNPNPPTPNPLDPDPKPGPKPPVNPPAGKVIQHPAGFQFAAPQGWQSQQQGPGFMLMPPAPQGERPPMIMMVTGGPLEGNLSAAKTSDAPEIMDEASKVMSQILPALKPQGKGQPIVATSGKFVCANFAGVSQRTGKKIGGKVYMMVTGDAKLIVCVAAGLADVIQANQAIITSTVQSVTVRVGNVPPTPPNPDPKKDPVFPRQPASFAGTFTGGTPNAPVVVKLVQQGNRVTGLMQTGVAKYETKLQGTVDDLGRLNGQATNSGGRASFVAATTGRTLTCSFTPLDQAGNPGKEKTATYTFQRQGAGPVGPDPSRPKLGASPFDGTWNDGNMILIINGNRLIVTFADDPDEQEPGTLKVVGNKLHISVEGDTEIFTYQWVNGTLVLTSTDGDKMTFRRGRPAPGAQDSEEDAVEDSEEGPGARVPQPRQPQPAAAGSIDRRLVGNWRNTISKVSGGKNNTNFVSEIYCQLRADGSFRYGDGQALVSQEHRSGNYNNGSKSNKVIVGRWKAENSILYSMPNGTNQWIALGRYSVSGNAMLLYLPNGGKQYWER